MSILYFTKYDQCFGVDDFTSSIFIRKSKKPEDASEKLGLLMNTPNGPLSSGLVLEMLDNQVMYDPSVEPMECVLIGWELNNDDNDSVFNDNCFCPNDDDEEGIDNKVPPSLSVNREGNNMAVDNSPPDKHGSYDTQYRKALYEWAIELEQTRSRVMKGVYVTVPEIEVAGCKKIYIWSFQKSLHSLLTNAMLVKANNLSFPQAEDPTLPVQYPELQGNIDIDKLHHSEWWINTWEKRHKTDPNEILVPIILYMDGIATNNSGQTTLTPLNMTLGIFNTLTWNSWLDVWETIYFHSTGTCDKGDKLIDNVSNPHSGLSSALSSLRDASNLTDGIEWWSNLPWNKKKWSA
eukprot:jgi/Psemu1/60762/gm1.60762_g